MTQTQLAALEETLQSFMNDVEALSTLDQTKLADIQRAADALKSMVENGSSMKDAVHSLIFMVSRLAIMLTPVEKEIERRQAYCRMMFEYMTEAMSIAVCPHCHYPHHTEIDCTAVELDLDEVEPEYYEPPSRHLH